VPKRKTDPRGTGLSLIADVPLRARPERVE
jgi:hypothetical protein